MFVRSNFLLDVRANKLVSVAGMLEEKKKLKTIFFDGFEGIHLIKSLLAEKNIL